MLIYSIRWIVKKFGQAPPGLVPLKGVAGLVIGTSTLLLLYIGILLFFFLLGFPVAFSLGLTAVALMLMGIGGGLNEAIIVSRMFPGR